MVAGVLLIVGAFLAYVFGAGYVSARGVGAPPPWNAAGAALIGFAAVRAAHALVAGRRRAAGFAAAAVAAGAALAIVTVGAILLPRL